MMYICMCGSCSLVSDCAALDVDLATGEREARHASEKSCRGLAGLSIVVSLVSLRSHSDLLILTQPKTPTQPACWLDLCLYIVSCISKSLLVHPLTKDMIVSKHLIVGRFASGGTTSFVLF